jgi:hypothetical protein
MATHRADPHASDYPEIAREKAAEQAAIARNTPRLAALCEALATRERELYDGGLVLLSGRLHHDLEQLQLCLGHACYEVSEQDAAIIRARWGLVGCDREKAS